MQLARYIRLLMAILFVLTASLGTVASAHALCADGSGPLAGHEDGRGHDHGANAFADHSHGKTTKFQDQRTFDGDASGVTTVCHGNAGCPGCAFLAGAILPSIKETTIAFRHGAIEGNSIEPDSSLRPPKFS